MSSKLLNVDRFKISSRKEDVKDVAGNKTIFVETVKLLPVDPAIWEK